jgi:Ca2+-binding EF-hand superfamily protein
MLTIASRSRLAATVPPAARAFAASPWGTDHWRHDKQEFIQWARRASKEEKSRERREFYAFCSISFGDVDTDKDGFINYRQFDRLLESVAATPRRFGLAPQSTLNYEDRLAQHKALFDRLDTAGGPARGVIAMDQFVDWAFEHVIGKVDSIPEKDVALLHVENYTEKEYLDFIEIAVNDKTSYNRSTFYNFMLNLFVEADESCSGRVNRAQFDALLTRAAHVPRHFGLAPPEVDKATRDKMFDSMELRRGDQRTGYVTFRKFYEWSIDHIAEKIRLHKAGK